MIFFLFQINELEFLFPHFIQLTNDHKPNFLLSLFIKRKTVIFTCLQTNQQNCIKFLERFKLYLINNGKILLESRNIIMGKIFELDFNGFQNFHESNNCIFIASISIHEIGEGKLQISLLTNFNASFNRVLILSCVHFIDDEFVFFTKELTSKIKICNEELFVLSSLRSSND